MGMRVFKQVPRILFGRDSIGRIQELLPKKLGASDYYVYVVDSVHKKTMIANRLNLADADMLIYVDTENEPSTTMVDNLKAEVMKSKNTLPKAVIGIGGGSAMDLGKGLAVMLTNAGNAKEYQGWDLVKNPAVFKVGVPTLSGSGSEASRTAVFYSEDKKFGINSDFSMYDAILMDPSLLATVPAAQRFWTAMDCYIHSVESIEGTMINDLARSYALNGLRLCRKYFLEDGTDDELMVASFMGGASVVNSEVGICHALSYGISLELGYHHGIANCIVFNVLDEYYGIHVNDFREMLKKHHIKLPENVCAGVSPEGFERMIAMTFRMEKPLTNALGPNWREILSKEKVIELYRRM